MGGNFLQAFPRPYVAVVGGHLPVAGTGHDGNVEYPGMRIQGESAFNGLANAPGEEPGVFPGVEVSVGWEVNIDTGAFAGCDDADFTDFFLGDEELVVLSGFIEEERDVPAD